MWTLKADKLLSLTFNGLGAFFAMVQSYIRQRAFIRFYGTWGLFNGGENSWNRSNCATKMENNTGLAGN